ncbi:MAG: OsmC family peroxiredoxin [Gaiellaceae bacterium]
MSAKEIHQTATVVWVGTIARGGGEVSGGSGALGPLGVDMPTRLGEAEGKTTPEELLAAAHATCFTTALGSVLAGKRMPPERLEVHARVTLDLSGDRPQISLIELEAIADAPGADNATIAEAVSEAEERCLISRVLREGTTIRVSGRLA